MVQDLRAAKTDHVQWPIGAKSLLTLRWVRPLRRLLSTTGAHIVHVRSRLPAWIAWLAWRGMDPATRPHLVTTVHGRYTVNAYSAIMTRGERVIAPSESIRAYIFENYPQTPAERVCVIPRGVSSAAFPYAHRPPLEWLHKWRADHPALAGKYLITLPARISRQKGHDDFIRVTKALKDNGLPVHGLIAGPTAPKHRKLLAQLKAAVRRNRLSETITFLGQRPDIREVLAISDCVLSLSNKPEAFGRTALEALSLGKPVFGYDHGGTAEILNRLFPSGLTAVRDVGAITAKIDRCYTDPPIIPRQHPFTLQAMLNKTLAVYEALVTTSD